MKNNIQVTESQNCLSCNHRRLKDINYSLDGTDEEIICYCSLDNHYIGYFEEAVKEVCHNFID